MEGGVIPKKTAGKDTKGQMHDHLFSLSLDDILDEHFYEHKVENIPESFESLQQYFGSYIFPLLEEIRAELSSNLKSIARAPFSEVISVEESKPYGTFSFKVNIGSFRNGLYNPGKEPYRTVPEDLFLVMESKPESVINSKSSIKNWALALVENVPYNGGSSPLSLKLQASKDIRPKDGKGETLFVVFLMNLTTHLRIWRSLHLHGNTKIIEQVLSSNSIGNEICGECSLASNAVFAEILERRLSSLLNDSQKEAVLSCVYKTFCYHKSSVDLIWGPPGTGKTKTVSILLWTILGMNCRVLACAPTNIAITELAARVVKLLKESYEMNDLFCSLGDVLLYGNKDRLNFGSELEEVHLDYRVDVLSKCFGAQTGWKHCLTLMIKLLDDSILMYNAFLQSKLKEESGENEDKSFLGFMREQFKSNALELKRCLTNMSTHVPKRFLLDRNLQNMEILVKLIDDFEIFLYKDDLVSEELQLLFSYPESVPIFLNSSLYTAELPYLRRGCLSVMKTLLISLDQLKLPTTSSQKSLKNFCLQRASLILCTVSTSYKLYSIKMEPVDLLLIDEAAQLRECESTIPLQIPGVRHAILIGDEFQLPAYVASEVSSRAGFGRSLFERLSSLGHSKHLLNTQYRMHPSISCFPNSNFYNNQIFDAPTVKSETRYLSGKMFGPYSFINVHGGKEGRDDGGSLKNMVEVAVVIKIIKKLYAAWRSSSRRKLSIGVISPYAAQVMAIQDKLGRSYEKFDDFSVKVKSVDGFQGSEEDVIIISTVRSNSKGNIGFLSNPQRINVALTRARHSLWILGDERTLGSSNSDWKAVVRNAKARKCFFNAEEDTNLANAIMDSKKELLELDDLLSKDSILFRKARWKVLLSDNFRASFQILKSIQKKKSIIILLLRLSTGWCPKNDEISFVESSDLLKHVKVEGLYVVYSIDIEKDSKYIQVLKIWDIMPLDDVQMLVKSLFDIYGLYTKEFLDHCEEKSLEGDLQVPITWSASNETLRYKDEYESIASSESTDSSIAEKNLNMKEILLRMKFQALSYQNVKQLLDGCDGRQLNLPYEIPDQQLEIIFHPTSLFVIGRPGTEKTASLATKLFQREQDHLRLQGRLDEVSNNKIQGAVLRQLFVTVTPKQCVAVKQHFYFLKRITCGERVSEGEVVDQFDMHDIIDGPAWLMDIPNSFVNFPSNLYPLFITFRKFLMMLDGSVGPSYFDKFHKLWELSRGKSRLSMSSALESFIRTKEVNYERFISSYWPYFNSRLTKNLDGYVVFNEITSQIKGGLQAGESRDGKISRHDYVLLSKGHSSVLSKKKREKIYEIFLDYEKTKMEKGEYDLADMVIDLHRRLRDDKYTGEKMDFVYVDEVQGLTMRQIALFKRICDNVDSGFVFSSNTAQTIARGIDYRVRDLRLLFYKEFIVKRRSDPHENGTSFQVISDIFHMSQNINANSRILQLAQSVVELLFRFFPFCIDILYPETSETSAVKGETPVFLECEKCETAVTAMFEKNVKNIGLSTFGFGAEQIILVRDECERKKTSDLIGNQGIVLTIMECQCLEFQDVLLYNFFTSSPLENHWQVIYQYMEEQDMLKSAPSRSSPSFIQGKFNDLCWELKLLYVATTRSRNRLWVYEDNRGISNPILDYWKKLHLIQARRLNFSYAQELQVANTKEAWSSQGLKLFSEGIYDMASKCFHRAEDTQKEKWARAAALRSAASNLLASNLEMGHYIHRDAAEIFNTLGRADLAAKCLIQSKDYEKAAKLYLSECGEQMLEEAGDCYTLAECYDFAADVYSRGKYWSKFLYVCTIAEFFDMELEFIQGLNECDSSMDERSSNIGEIKQAYLEKGALHYHLHQDKKTMMKFVTAFNSMDLRRTFLNSLGCLDDILLLEKESGNFVEAAATLMKKGDLLLAVDLLEKAGLFKNASSLVLFYVLFKSLWASEEVGWPLKQFEQKEKLLMRAKLLARNESECFYKSVCTEVNILSNQAITMHEMKQNWSASLGHGNLKPVILSARQILDAHLSSSASEYIWEDDRVTDPITDTEPRISLNQASLETLVYFWNFWAKKIENLLTCLDCPDSQDYISYEDFCLSYLGVSKQLNGEKTIHIFLVPEVYWAKKIEERFAKGNGSMDGQQFVAAAKSFWCLELFSVGMKVFRKINDLHIFSISTTSSLVSHCATAGHVFVLAKFLTDAEYVKLYIDHDTLGQIFDVGLKSILYLRMNHQAQNVLLVNMSGDMHNFLLKCALHYHQIEDYCTTLKFVRAFDSTERKCSFLSSLGCFNKILLLEVEAGYLSEAVAIVRFKGDLLLEVDLLEKNGSHKDASLLLLFYGLATSLWGSTSKGWPLKEFKNKQKLLKRAKSIAEKESNIFYEMVSTEANILSNKPNSLCEMAQNLTASTNHKNLRGIVLSARKILDALFRSNVSSYEWESELVINPREHSERTLSQNRVSAQTLVYFWNFWMDSLVNIFDYLSSVEGKESSEYESHEDFCLSYLGVWREVNNQGSVYRLLYPDAEWTKKVEDGSVESMTSSQFFAEAFTYWRSEVLSVGVTVMEKLKELFIFSISNSFPQLYQSMAGIHFIEVVNSLTETKFFKSASGSELKCFFHARLQFINSCKKHLRQVVSMANCGDKINGIKLALLRECALHYHTVQDDETMMTFVKQFHSMDSKRIFLKSLGCYDELLSLEKESGNFLEAASIARIKGDLFLEVDLLEKAGQLQEAAKTILLYVLANSLWGARSKGWPLKFFKQREVLLSKAKSFAKQHSDHIFYEIVCTEASLLLDSDSSLSEINRQLTTSRKNGDITSEILSAWKILDAHFCSNSSVYEWEIEVVTHPMNHSEEKLCHDQVSIGTLFQFWSFWKNNILSVIKSLKHLAAQNSDSFSPYDEFCLKYLGVRKQLDNQTSYQLLISDAEWAMHIDLSSLHGDGKLVSMDSQAFAMLAMNYWSTEVLSVGMKVLEKLSALHLFSVENSLSVFHQSLTVIQLFGVSKFLKGSKLYINPADDQSLGRYLESSVEHFSENVFGLSWMKPITENMSALRGAAISRGIHKELVSKIIESEEELTVGKIGRIIMVILGSGNLTISLYNKIAKKMNKNPLWKAVVDELKRHAVASNVPQDSSLVVPHLHKALKDTFPKWRNEADFIAPDCFLYILERQLVLISNFRRHFYTTRSSFIEQLVSDVGPFISKKSRADISSSFADLYGFIKDVVHQLVVNNCGAREWIKRSNINSKEYYPVFLLRLVILMCLLCLNSGRYHDVLYDILGKRAICSQLPSDFYDVLKNVSKRKKDQFVQFLGDALWKIKNPLVEARPNVRPGGALSSSVIVISMKTVENNEETRRVLFPENQQDGNGTSG